MTTRLSLNGFVLLSVVAVLSTVPSCSTAEPGEGDSESNLRISLAPSVVTRVTGTSFDEDDAIGLSVVPWVNGTEQPLSSSRWEDNVKFVYRDGQFVSTSTAYFPDATTPNTFYAYYPYDAAGFASGASTLKVSTASDQRDAKARMTSDWLVAVTRNVVPNGKAVPVVFRHVLSQMQIRMIAGEGITNEELLYAGIVLKDFGTVADYDVDAESFGDVSEKTDILPSGSWAIDGGYVTGMSAIVVPQTRKAGESVIYFTYAGKTLAYKPSSDFTFESGRSHLFTATISMTSQGPTLSVSAQIDDWQEGGVITGDADQPQTPQAPVKDIDGNEYPVVKIGDLYWMAANLRTQHLIDGTEIPVAKGNEASWDGLTSPAACDFMDKTENRSTYGLLYNYYTVDTGKLCPEGWSVPDWDQMQSLLDAVPNAADLMAPDSRWSHYNPTNASGFGALPGGITSYYGWFTGDCGIWTSYKSENSPYYLYLTNSPYIDYYYMYSGMYVRCVKVN